MIRGTETIHPIGLDRTPPARSGRPRSAGRFAALLLALFCAALAGACGAGRPIRYYQLTIPGEAPAGPATDPAPVTLLIGTIQASHLYREDHIVYSNGATEMGTYQSHRWAQPPTEMLEEVLLRELRGSGRFRAVNAHRTNATGDFLLRGQLFDFKEVSEGTVIGRCTFELELQELKTGKTVWTHYYTHDEPAASKDVPALVAALDRNAQLGARAALSSLQQYFASHPAK